MSHTKYDAGKDRPEMEPFNGLDTYAVHAVQRVLSRMGIDRHTVDMRALLTGMSDEELLANRQIGHKALAVIRSRFPYEGSDRSSAPPTTEQQLAEIEARLYRGCSGHEDGDMLTYCSCFEDEAYALLAEVQRLRATLGEAKAAPTFFERLDRLPKPGEWGLKRP